MTDPYLEKVAAFGQNRGLVGILTLPAGGRVAGTPHIILLNSGILHRVGTNRLHVSLARALASAGMTTLRFDLSGIGDSERRGDVQSLRESVERDIGDAIGYLCAVHGATRVVLMGVCSGAYDAMHAALGDTRVAGAVLVDIPGPFQTWRHTAHHLGARVFRLASWRRPVEKAARYARVLFGSPGAAKAASGIDGGADYIRGTRRAAPRERMEAQLATLLDRGVRLLVVFTPGVEANYNHRSQFRTTFPAAAAHASLSFDYLKTADHAFSRREDRSRLVTLIVEWMQRQAFEMLPRDQGAAEANETQAIS